MYDEDDDLLDDHIEGLKLLEKFLIFCVGVGAGAIVIAIAALVLLIWR